MTTSSNTEEIPYFFDNMKWECQKPYQVRMANIYDVSKFWLVFKHKQLTKFQEILTDFYNRFRELYIMEELKRDDYCAMLYEGKYYRGVIVNIPFPSSSQQCRVLVFAIDFGYISGVPSDNVFKLAEYFYKEPRHAVRAVLTGIQPIDTYQWPMDANNRFRELTADKILHCVVKDIHSKYRTLYVYLMDMSNPIQGKSFHDVGDQMILDKMASVGRPEGMVHVKPKKFVPKTKYPYLFPSFEAVEKCRVPFTAETAKLLQHYEHNILLQPSHMIDPYDLKF